MARFLEDEPVAPQRELDALRFGRAHGLPVPDVAAADLTGSEVGDGVPALLMSLLPGRALAAPDAGRLRHRHLPRNLLGWAGPEVPDAFVRAHESLTGEPQHPYWEIVSVFEHGPSRWSGQHVAESERRLARALAALGGR